MPFVYITTNLPREKLPKDFNKTAAEKFSQIIGQPVEYLAVIVNAGADLSMCGSDEPAVVLVIKARDTFSAEKNDEFFKQAADFFRESLNIKQCRTYSEFEEYNPSFIGVCGMTLSKVLEMMAKGGPEMTTRMTCVCGEVHDMCAKEIEEKFKKTGK